MNDIGKTRETTFEERATWGKCPVCGAGQGEWGLSTVGFSLGVIPDGKGVHLGRLQNAPQLVKLVVVK